MIRYALIVCVIFLVSTRPAGAQELSGSFISNSSGEDFNVESNDDGTADIYGSDGRHVGEAEDNGDGTWAIQSSTGRPLGQIQDNGEGSFDVYGSKGGYWGSGDTE
jgi:hypothetical protein